MQRGEVRASIKSLDKSQGRDAELCYVWLVQTLTPLQMARCVVRSFPWYPDIPAITTWMAAQHGDPEAQGLLKSLMPNVKVEL